MPGVAINPPPKGDSGFGSSSNSKWMSPPPNSHVSHKSQASVTAAPGAPASARFYDGLSVADLKQKAKDSVLKEARGVSAITLIKSARSQIHSAKEHEAKGDLRTALGNYIKAASLTKMTMDSQEYAQENRAKGGGVIRKELNDFLETDGRDISARTTSVEEKLRAIEKQANDGQEPRSPATGKSIKDRLRALQDHGLSIEQPTSRAPRELPTPPISPRTQQVHPVNPLPAPVAITPAPSSSASSRMFVPTSTLGPPSPTSSTSSPPKNNYLNNDDINGFNRAFPSIDELDQIPAFLLPSAPHAPPMSASSSTHSNGVSPKPLLNTKDSKPQLRNGDQPISPLVSFRNFAIPIERPSSTPITPTNNAFGNSRPPSPTISKASAAISSPFKPSGLSNGVPSSGTSTPRIPLPQKNTAFPRDLQTYLRDHNVLLIDVRHRAEFDREHIKADAVVCIEPSVLMRDGVTAESLEQSMVIGPRQEVSVFSNRDKFDLVAVYDNSTTSFASGEQRPLSILIKVIFEQAFKKTLKRMPMLLIGGIEAWKRELGEGELIRGPGYVRQQHAAVELRKPIPVSPGQVSTLASAAAAQNEDYNPSRHHPTMPMDQQPATMSGHMRSPADSVYSGAHSSAANGSLSRRPAIARPPSTSISFSRSNELPPSTLSNGSGSFVPSTSPITYPQFPRKISPNSSEPNAQHAAAVSPSSLSSQPPQQPPFSPPPVPGHYDITSPPQASINQSQLSSRKRSDFVDQSQEALMNSMRSPTGLGNSGSIGMGIDYPELTSPTIVRPPPVASPPTLTERQARVQQSYFPPTQSHPSSSSTSLTAAGGALTQTGLSNGGPKAPRISSDYPVNFWSDIQIGTSGLKNLGNTCYMNAPIQCLSATVPFARFFTEGRWKSAINFTNPLGTKGKLTGAFAKLVHEMWGGDFPYLTPIDFRRSICSLKSQYNGSDQHDSQEFLSFLIDGIHEDLNRIIVKPSHTRTPEQEAELEKLPAQIASDREWKTWRDRNDSLIVDFFQGQFRNRLECLTCHKTSTTYNVFSILSLPVPSMRSSKVPIEKCLDAFFNAEVLEKDDAWDCPTCKVKRPASKTLSLARLPPVLMIHLKRFEANGRFSDKVDTFVDFPVKSLDLTGYMPPPLPAGADQSQLNGGLPMSPDDPRTQLPPYRYDLYGVTNHFGNLSSGHYTAFIASRGGWLYCDDSSVKQVDPKQVVNQKAYVLFYKRARN